MQKIGRPEGFGGRDHGLADLRCNERMALEHLRRPAHTVFRRREPGIDICRDLIAPHAELRHAAFKDSVQPDSDAFVGRVELRRRHQRLWNETIFGRHGRVEIDDPGSEDLEGTNV